MKSSLLKDNRFKPFQDEFKDLILENRFRKSTFANDFFLFKGILTLAIFALTFFLFMDLLFKSDISSYEPFIILRVIIILICLFIYHQLSTSIKFAKLDTFVSIALACITSMVIISNIYRPTDYFTHGAIDIGIVSLLYFSNSIALKYRVLINILYSIGLLTVLFYIKEPKYHFTYISYTSSVIFINVFSFIIAILLGRTKRINYDLLLNEKKLHEEIKTLKGIIPICSYCKNIRDDEGSWEQLESYIDEHSDAQFSHGICPKCNIKIREEEGIKLK
jgi:hypothetical protein